MNDRASIRVTMQQHKGGRKEGCVVAGEGGRKGATVDQAKRPKTFQFSWKFGQRFVERQINLRVRLGPGQRSTRQTAHATRYTLHATVVRD